MCFWVRDGSVEYPQHMFWLKIENIIFKCTSLSGGLQLFSVAEQVGLNLTRSPAPKTGFLVMMLI